MLDYLAEREEFERLTRLHNAGELSVEEYDRWCQLKRVLRRTDLGVRRIVERRTDRLQVRLRARLFVPEPVAVQTVDLSRGGAQVRCPRAAAAGARVELAVALPGEEEPLRIPCEVAWSDPERQTMGLRFLALPADRAEALAAYIAAEQILRRRGPPDPPER